MKIFPKEIMHGSVEKHFSRFSSKSQIIYMLLILSVISVAIILPVVKVDISVQSRGIIRSLEEPNQILSPINAQVQKIAISENIPVTKGDTLVWFQKEKIEESLLLLQQKSKQLEEFISDIENMLNYRFSKLTSARYISEHAQYRQRLKELDLQIRQMQREYERAKNLLDKAVIALIEFEQKEFAFHQKTEEKDLYVKQKRNEWNTALAQFTTEKASLETEIKQTNMQALYYAIIAGIDGTVSNFTGIAPGDFILTNQQIAILVPTGNLVAESYVSASDIGYLRKGMTVRFQIDAYNYNEWGLANGEIIDISDQPTQSDGIFLFKVRCRIEQQALYLKNGYSGPLKNGMSLTARFLVTRRSLFQLLYDKADQWMNPQIVDIKPQTR